MPTSQRQIEANRSNAQHSTGPKTEEGKAKSSLNARRTGLTGHSIMLSADEADLYEHHVARFACEFNPVGDREHELVQSLADTQWRINRVPILEAGVYAAGRVRYADLFPEEPAEIRRFLIDSHTFLTHCRELNNLSIQESRLHRQYAKDLAELKSLQADRHQAAKGATLAAAALATHAAANGFEFAAEVGAAPNLADPGPTDRPAAATPAPGPALSRH